MKLKMRVFREHQGFAASVIRKPENGPSYVEHQLIGSTKGQILHKLSEIMRDAGVDFYSSSHLPAGEYKRTRPRSQTRRKYGFYRRHKESLERSKASQQS